jgi:hypothetical protein
VLSKTSDRRRYIKRGVICIEKKLFALDFDHLFREGPNLE